MSSPLLRMSPSLMLADASATTVRCTPNSRSAAKRFSLCPNCHSFSSVLPGLYNPLCRQRDLRHGCPPLSPIDWLLGMLAGLHVISRSSRSIPFAKRPASAILIPHRATFLNLARSAIGIPQEEENPAGEKTVRQKMPPPLPEGVERQDLHISSWKDGWPLAMTIFTPRDWKAQKKLLPAVLIGQATGVPARYYQSFAM